MSLNALLKNLPNRPGIYKFKAQDGRVLYVGKAKNLKKRVQSYFRKQKHRPIRTQKLIENTVDLEWVEVGSDLEALLLETNLIKELKPKYNVLMKDDKNFVYIKITKNEDYPRIKIVRRVEKDGAVYFGPKTAAGKVKKTLLLLQKLFMFRSCDLGIDWQGEGKAKVTRKTIAYPCLDYHIKRCAGPCIGAISPEEYAESMTQIEAFLKGDTKGIEAFLKKQMAQCVADKKFERAAQLRDKLLLIQELMEKQIVSSPGQERMDIFSFVIEDGKAFFTLFVLRDGKLVNQENFVVSAPGFEAGDEAEAPEILEGFLTQYYQRAVDFPPEILIPYGIPEQDFFEEWLRQQRDGRVHLRTPQRGKKHQLLELAAKNARSFMKQHQARWAGFEPDQKAAVQELAEALSLNKSPKRIECYDISHLSGTDTVASMVVFEHGAPKKSDYRKFRLRSLEKGEVDDFKSMREVLNRRLSYLSKGPAGVKIRKAARSHKKDLAFLSEQWRDSADVQGEHSEYFIAWSEKKPVGMIRLMEGKNGCFLLASLYVLPDWRRKGVGRALMRHAIQKAKAKRVYVACKESLSGFYESFGFQAVKQFPKDLREHIEQACLYAYDPSKHKDASFHTAPQLIVIDGGKGQLNAALAIRDQLGLAIPMIGLAKREEDVYLPGKSMPLLLAKDSAALQLLQRLRNEAHRFAVRFQKQQRKKHLTESVLDEIEGLGEKTKMKLLKHFGSVAEIQKSSPVELEGLVGETLAARIKAHL